MGRGLIVRAAVTVALLGFGPNVQAAELPRGTFVAAPQADWAITFAEKGRFTVNRGGKAVVEGSYQATDTELTLTDEAGPFAAKEAAAKTGKYKWALTDGKLKFTLVQDKSTGRELLLTLNTWSPRK